jgi:hypothetical protein
MLPVLIPILTLGNPGVVITTLTPIDQEFAIAVGLRSSTFTMIPKKITLAVVLAATNSLTQASFTAFNDGE